MQSAGRQREINACAVHGDEDGMILSGSVEGTVTGVGSLINHFTMSPLVPALVDPEVKFESTTSSSQRLCSERSCRILCETYDHCI